MRIENKDLIIPTYDYEEDDPNKNYGHEPDLRDYRDIVLIDGDMEFAYSKTVTKDALIEFSKHTGIPVRTIEDWESGRRTPPEYIPRLIAYQMEYEKLVKKSKKG